MALKICELNYLSLHLLYAQCKTLCILFSFLAMIWIFFNGLKSVHNLCAWNESENNRNNVEQNKKERKNNPFSKDPLNNDHPGMWGPHKINVPIKGQIKQRLTEEIIYGSYNSKANQILRICEQSNIIISICHLIFLIYIFASIPES